MEEWEGEVEEHEDEDEKEHDEEKKEKEEEEEEEAATETSFFFCSDSLSSVARIVKGEIVNVADMTLFCFLRCALRVSMRW